LASKLVESNSNLLKTARLNSELCNTVKCQLYKAVRPKNQLYRTARPKLHVVARSKQSPLVDSKGQWTLYKEIVGLGTPIATVQTLSAKLEAEDSEASYLLELVRLQAVTREEAKKAT
jgi:hypothetical protein